MSKKKILVIGSSNTDMTIRAEHLPVPGETILGGEFVMGRGGKGANQAVAASRLGGDVTFVCKVGRDLFGQESVLGYKNESIDTSHILFSEKPSGVALIMVAEDGENCISVASSANDDFSVEDVESLRELICASDYLILQLEIPVASVQRATEIAHEAGVYVILNPAPAVRLPEEIYHNIDLLTPNQTELALLTGIKDDNQKAADKLADMGVPSIIVTMGSQGCAVIENGEYSQIDALKVKSVDATAAGDTFCGALCVALSEGQDLKNAARFATKAAALTVQRRGAQESIPHRNEIDEKITH